MNNEPVLETTITCICGCTVKVYGDQPEICGCGAVLHAEKGFGDNVRAVARVNDDYDLASRKLNKPKAIKSEWVKK